MTAQHTPGPWKAHFEESYFVTGPDLGRVAMMMNLKGAHGLGGRRSGEEAAANARLIAAAPEMATWLAWALNRMPEEVKSSYQYEAATAVLQKARGGAHKEGA